MADSNLSTSISAIRTKILNDAPTATVDELVSLARAAKSIGLTEDTTIETAINSRANTLSSNASTNDMVKLSNAIKQLRNTTAGAVSPSTTSDDIVEGTSNLYHTDARVDARIALNSAGVTVYADMAALIAATGMSNGDQAYVTTTNQLYLYNSGWFLVATGANNPPSAISGVDASYNLAKDGTATVITAISTDPEGFPLTWSYAVTTGTLGTTATVSQTNNVFTITPSTTQSDAGEFSITFSATDGVNTISAVADFTLSFTEDHYFIDPRNHGMSTGTFSGVGIDTNDQNLYVLGYSGDQRVYRWELGTAEELASIPSTYTQRAGISNGTPSGFYMRHDGLGYYYCSYGNVYQVSLSTANDLTSSTQTNYGSTTGGQAFNNGGLIFGGTLSHTGDRLYINETNANTIREHPLNTNWDISTAQNATNTFNPNNVTYAYGMQWSTDGMKLWLGESRYIREYTASSAYSLSGMNATPSASFDTQSLNNSVDNFTANNIGNAEIRGISVSSDGNRLYLNLRNFGVFKLTMVTQNTIADGFIF